MVKLIKKGDTYKQEKLEASILRAGASKETAKKVVDSVQVRDGMTTLELRNLVTAKLKELDSKAAKKYESFKKRK
jgi:methionine aminopeptidase